MAEALKIPPLDRAEVLAGSTGLDHLITFVTVMEVPEMADLVQPGELLLTTGYPLRDKPDLLMKLIPRIAEKGLAGLGIKPTYLNPIPEEMIQAADDVHFPLLRIPVDIVLDEIIQPVLTAVLNRQMAILEFSDRVRNSLVKLVLQGLGIREVAYSLAELVGNPVAIVDASGMLLASDPSPLKSRQYPQLLDRRFHKTDNGSIFREPKELSITPQSSSQEGTNIWREIPLLDGTAVRELQRVVQVGYEVYAHLLVWETNRGLNELDLQAVFRAGTVTALDITRQRAVEATERSYQYEFLEEILSGESRDRRTVLQRARLFGWEISGRHTASILDIDNFYHQYVLGKREVDQERSRVLLESYRMVTTSVSKWFDKRIIVNSHSDSIVLIIPGGDEISPDNTRHLVQTIASSVSDTFPDLSISAGIGNPCDDFLEMGRSYREAREALDLGRKLWGGGNVYSFEDLGVYRLVCKMDRSTLEDFSHRELGPLLAYDQKYGTGLLETLEAILDRNLSLSKAAQALDIHYNTLKYRLQRIEELCGNFRQDAHKRLSLEIGLKAQRVLERGSCEPS